MSDEPASDETVQNEDDKRKRRGRKMMPVPGMSEDEARALTPWQRHALRNPDKLRERARVKAAKRRRDAGVPERPKATPESREAARQRKLKMDRDRARERSKDPEFRAARRAYEREYRQRPEVKEVIAERDNRRHKEARARNRDQVLAKEAAKRAAARANADTATDPTIRDRFWAKVQRAGPDDCWLWTAHTMKAGGYGSISCRGLMEPAHRVAWYLAHGRWPADGMDLHHRCRNPLCVNVAHLRELPKADHSRHHASGDAA